MFYWSLSFRGTVEIIGLVLLVSLIAVGARDKMKGESAAAYAWAWGVAILGIAAMVRIMLIN